VRAGIGDEVGDKVGLLEANLAQQLYAGDPSSTACPYSKLRIAEKT
jgi:hypothetical protein